MLIRTEFSLMFIKLPKIRKSYKWEMVTVASMRPEARGKARQGGESSPIPLDTMPE
jgi:hypothetical protein